MFKASMDSPGQPPRDRLIDASTIEVVQLFVNLRKPRETNPLGEINKCHFFSQKTEQQITGKKW